MLLIAMKRNFSVYIFQRNFDRRPNQIVQEYAFKFFYKETLVLNFQKEYYKSFKYVDKISIYSLPIYQIAKQASNCFLFLHRKEQIFIDKWQYFLPIEVKVPISRQATTNNNELAAYTYNGSNQTLNSVQQLVG